MQDLPEPLRVNYVETKAQPAYGFRSAGASERGEVKNGINQDAFYTSSKGFNFGEIGLSGKESPDQPHRIINLANELVGLNLLEKKGSLSELDGLTVDIITTHGMIKDLILAGKIKSLDIVCDGIGGHGKGEVASGIVSYVIAREVAKKISKSSNFNLEDVVRSAVSKASEILGKYNKKNKSKISSTFVVALTGADDETALSWLGDARAYKRDAYGHISLETEDSSQYNNNIISGIATPAGVYQAVDSGIVDEKNFSTGGLIEKNVFFKKTRLDANEELILCCDGVWKGAKVWDKEFARNDDVITKAREIYLRYVEIGQGRNIQQAAKIAYSYIFQHLNLKGIPDSIDDQVKFLTRDEVGKESEDNVTAVIVKNEQPKEDKKYTVDDIKTATNITMLQYIINQIGEIQDINKAYPSAILIEKINSIYESGDLQKPLSNVGGLKDKVIELINTEIKGD
jgi:serine/threonine protein phosphatase PrpC